MPETTDKSGNSKSTQQPHIGVSLTGSAVGGDVVGGNKTVTVVGSRADARERRDQLILLENVRQFWVKGVLENSVHSEALIELGKQSQPAAVEHPWGSLLELPEKASQPIPPGKKSLELFNDMGRMLLILGEPGAGKTVTLLELARDLIACAESDPAQPIPVVFNLASWAERRPPLIDWLTDELSLKYRIPRKIARGWLDANDLLPLLDGLDEVRAEHRAACVEAINAFYSDHSLAGIAVCSRREEYELLKEKLKLGGAILLQPLTDEQVVEYLGSVGGARLHSLYQALRSDALLREMAQSPLMLSVMSMAYVDAPLDELPGGPLITPEARRTQLFDTYVARMFVRVARTKNELYSKAQTIRWLSGLARGMKAHGQSVFLIEGLQRSWLQTSTQRLLYQLGVIISWAFIFTLCFLVSAFYTPLNSLQIAMFLASMLMFGAFLGWWSSTRDIVAVEAIKWSWKATLGLPFLKALLNDRREAWALLWREQTNIGFIGGALTGALTAVSSGILYSVIVGLDINRSLALVFYIGIALTLALGLLYAVLSGLSGVAVLAKTTPNQGIKQSAKNALFSILLSSVLGWAGGWAIGSYSRWIASELGISFISGFSLELYMASFGAALGTLAGFYAYGGSTVIKHYFLRLTLWRTRLFPFNLAHFLDYAADRIFLRKVGGGYIFIHRSILEYFAALDSN